MPDEHCMCVPVCVPAWVCPRVCGVCVPVCAPAWVCPRVRGDVVCVCVGGGGREQLSLPEIGKDS